MGFGVVAAVAGWGFGGFSAVWGPRSEVYSDCRYSDSLLVSVRLQADLLPVPGRFFFRLGGGAAFHRFTWGTDSPFTFLARPLRPFYLTGPFWPLSLSWGAFFSRPRFFFVLPN